MNVLLQYMYYLSGSDGGYSNVGSAPPHYINILADSMIFRVLPLNIRNFVKFQGGCLGGRKPVKMTETNLVPIDI